MTSCVGRVPRVRDTVILVAIRAVGLWLELLPSFAYGGQKLSESRISS
jgi:hypothetical protein